MKSTPKAQHYTPRFYLSGFLDPILVARGDESLWVYEAGRKPRKAKPKTTGFENYFYSFEIKGQKVHVVEQVLGSIESLCAPILSKIAGGSFDLTAEERSTFAAFVALSFTRTPFYRSFENEVLTAVLQKLMEIEASVPGYFEEKLKEMGVREGAEQEAQELRDSVKKGFVVEQVKGRAIGSALKMSLTLAPVIETMSWLYLVTEGSPAFVTTDAMISLFDPSVRPPSGMGFASSPSAEFRFPLTRKVCLVGNWQGLNGSIRVKPKHVREINKTAMYFSQRFMYASESSTKLRDLFTKLSKRRSKKRIKFAPTPG